ncbi:MAG: 50S ribosomal protein L10 [Bacteroidales bacterium]|nr:50S ribosomal protein L10 [Bacteroidales bacterium]
MRKEDKNSLIESIAEIVKSYSHFYVVDIEGLNAEVTSKLRRECFGKDIKLVVVKNALMKKALEQFDTDFSELDPAFKGNTAVMFCNTGNVPAKLIKEFSKNNEKPVLKGAYVEQSIYVGAENLDALVAIKSKEELIGDIVALLQSPAKNVISALQSGANTIHGVLETLSKK